MKPPNGITGLNRILTGLNLPIVHTLGLSRLILDMIGLGGLVDVIGLDLPIVAVGIRLGAVGVLLIAQCANPVIVETLGGPLSEFVYPPAAAITSAANGG
jgi:hypothetical protein